MVTVLFPAIILFVGLVVYLTASNEGKGPRTAEIGRIMFQIGLFFCVWWSISANMPHLFVR